MLLCTGVVKRADNVAVDVGAVVKLDFFHVAVAPQRQRFGGVVRHRFVGEERAFRAVDLEARARVLDRKGIVELREQAAAKAHRAHHRILHLFAQPLPLRNRRHRVDLIVEHKAQRIRIVDGDVQDDAAARTGRFDAPGLQLGRQVDGVENARGQRLANRAVGNQDRAS